MQETDCEVYYTVKDPYLYSGSEDPDESAHSAET